MVENVFGIQLSITCSCWQHVDACEMLLGKLPFVKSQPLQPSATVFFAVTCADVCCSVNVLCQGKSKVAAAGPHNATVMSGLSFDLDFLVCALVPSSSVHVLTGAIPQ